jgi:poly-gamma-glutamate synthesis protein (capsule biosynthesis protein)
VGDLLLSTPPGAERPGRGLEALSEDIRELFASCDVVFANLECTLPGRKTVPTEPRVVSTENQIASLRDSGINVVTLGNNHMFDCLEEGFERLSSTLTDIGIRWFGAGRNLSEAQRPMFLEAKGIRLAFIGCVDPSSGPYRFADKVNGGVAPLDMKRLCRLISNLSKEADHVIISPHWGRERFRIPSPQQVIQARAFIDAGSSMVLGHHPHVLQGMEIYDRSPVICSLGNFFANNVYWQDGDIMTWSRFERTSCIFVADLDAKDIHNIQQIPTFDDGEMVRIERSDWGKRCLSRANRMLGQGITPKRYNRERIYIETVKPIISHLRWAELRRLRPYHLRKVWESLQG